MPWRVMHHVESPKPLAGPWRTAHHFWKHGVPCFTNVIHWQSHGTWRLGRAVCFKRANLDYRGEAGPKQIGTQISNATLLIVGQAITNKTRVPANSCRHKRLPPLHLLSTSTRPCPRLLGRARSSSLAVPGAAPARASAMEAWRLASED